ncbi:MAG: hypothetical protein ACKVU4_12550 [Phycisphaerales bacterium]
MAATRSFAKPDRTLLRAWFWLVEAGLVAAIGLSGCAALLEGRRLIAAAPAPPAWVARFAGYGGIAIGVGFATCVQPYARPHAQLATAAGGAGVALLLLLHRRLLPLVQRPWFRRADRLVAARYPPGYLRYGFRCNSGGHYDAEFARKRPGRGLVDCIGDFFSAGIVRHRFRFTTVAEQRLPQLDSCNLGLPGIDPEDYLALLKSEALALDPDLITVQLFVGNDLFPRGSVAAPARAARRSDWLRDWLDARRLRLLVLPPRLMQLWTEGGVALSWSRRPRSIPPELDREMTDPDALRRLFPNLDDPLLESLRVPAATFERIEFDAARFVCGVDRVDLTPRFATLEAMVQAAASIRLCFVLIPDALQVEDALFTRVQAQFAAPLRRDAIQQRIVAGLEQRGLPCLDLLPRLLAAPPLADGERHCFHRGDTHFNARGNAIAGESLAEFLVAQGLR